MIIFLLQIGDKYGGSGAVTWLACELYMSFELMDYAMYHSESHASALTKGFGSKKRIK